ncbi:hypothetical protein LOD99_6694 [Oopsacas minuta]|uniref:Fe2OG dioxygenase domain-containing protein n=1 Tax=Oopsacas minuta TaxID=111878 RepID=A0AAV7JKR4_9METZ|nr:hypothetical protein LOD99_6694 [Oopsacas minuta]
MELLEDPTEIVIIQSFFKESGITLLDRSFPLLERLKQLSAITSATCMNCYASTIIRKVQQRLLICVYPPLHKPLFSLKNWPWSSELVSAVEKAKLGKISSSLNEVSRGLFMIEILPIEFCNQLLEEVANYESWCHGNQLSIHRPNTMNSYGAILDEFGFEPVLQELTDFIGPIFKLLYGEDTGNVGSHHGFVVEYELGKDLNLGFHVDDSQVTLNLCLGSIFTGGDLWFSGVRCPPHLNTPNTSKEYFTYSHIPGTGLIHMGKHRHGAKDLTSGKRSNLIVWFRSKKERDQELKDCQDKICPNWCWYGKSN